MLKNIVVELNGRYHEAACDTDGVYRLFGYAYEDSATAIIAASASNTIAALEAYKRDQEQEKAKV